MNIVRENMKLFCIVLGAMVLVLNGRDRRAEARSAFDTSDLEERDTDSNHFIGAGIEKIRRIPIPVESESGFEDQNSGEFPFKNGLRKYHRDPEKSIGIFDENVRPGDDGKFPFIPGVLRHDQTRTKPRADNFEETKDEYPFINGLRRPLRSANPDNGAKIDDDRVSFSNAARLCASGKSFPFVECLQWNLDSSKEIEKPDEDEDPFIDDFSDEDETPSVEDIFKNTHPIKKRSVENSNGTKVDLNAPTKVDKFMVEFGEAVEGDTELMEHIYSKTLKWNFRKGEPQVSVTYVEFPSNHSEFKDYPVPKTNSCPITNIIVKNAYRVGALLSEKVNIISGGIGQTHVKLAINSTSHFLDKFAVGIYGMCPKEQKEPICDKYCIYNPVPRIPGVYNYD